ncbi:double-strand break repair protein AddB [Hasllibacter sp. MH4015]|uniref:double-strand break repair protein AddB n=1 Tax=Hasllibacter sp. MH4015 TaxID=2854029 RepID=UPI001CD3B32F|nr:double-strand break repair protein AddB [Hasllibacter sp. MH4015]
MFETLPTPHVFATPLGVDFCAALIDGLDAQLNGQPPHALARVEVHVANARMQRRLQTLYAQRGPGLLPRIRPILSLSETADLDGVPPAMTPLALRFQLAQLIAKLIDANPDLAPRAALYDLSDSLADFMGEMVEEGVPPQEIAALDMGDHSDHWTRARDFLGIAHDLITGDFRPIPEARQAQVVDALIAEWRHNPPDHPVIVAGSTGSRRATFRLMEAVAALPQGAVILPGIDRDMPRALWQGLLDGRRDGLAGEDHPQFRLARLLDTMGMDPDQVPLWGDRQPANPARNRVVSLALRPAPVTDQWRKEGPKLQDVAGAMAGITLVEAPNPQMEATTIALRLRRAVEDGQRAALVTPDRRLARKVTAQLDRWRIVPDDSAGQVLSQTAPGRFMAQVAEAMTGPVTAEGLVALLKHPLCHTGADRSAHILRTRDLELQLLRRGLAFPNRAALVDWAEKANGDPGRLAWVDWLSDTLFVNPATAPRPMPDRVAAHIARAEALAAGTGTDGSGELYDKDSGKAMLRLLDELRADAPSGGAMSARDYADFFQSLAADREVRFALRPHADILIWGTQEARVQGADLTILAGLNEGTWPQAAEADPWLNRPLRAEVGLRLPDRVIGLSAHDFQQGIAAGEVWLCRAKRDDETDTVPSRWLNRLTNLLGGASAHAAQALDNMRDRGADWVRMAQALTQPAPDKRIAPAPRPAPAPQNAPRLTRLSVTEIERLIRDPYAIYARHMLRLSALDPLRTAPDARLRGNVIHDVLDAFVDQTRGGLPEAADHLFLAVADATLQDAAPWPAARRFWRQRLVGVMPWYLAQEAELRALAAPWLLERKERWDVPGLDLELTGKVDRIDKLPDGRVAIYDYKTGKVPTDGEAKHFNKQLLLEALMARGGAFADRALEVARLAYIGLGTNPDIRDEPVDAAAIEEVANGLVTLITHYRQRLVGFPSRRAVTDTRFDGDFDHLARLGEWDETDDPVVIPVGTRP